MELAQRTWTVLTLALPWTQKRSVNWKLLRKERTKWEVCITSCALRAKERRGRLPFRTGLGAGAPSADTWADGAVGSGRQEGGSISATIGGIAGHVAAMALAV